MSAEDHFDVSELAPFSRIEAYSSSEIRDLSERVSAAGSTIVFDEAGIHLVALERDASIVELDRKTFASYLHEEKRDDLLDHPHAASELIRERFSRHLKALVVVGETRNDIWKTVTGTRIEIVPLQDPLSIPPGEAIRVQLLFDEEPLSSTPISIYARDEREIESDHAVTDEAGIADLSIPSSGEILIRAVHIAPTEAGDHAQFESFWTALTYHLRPDNDTSDSQSSP